MSQEPKTIVVIPAYNEEATIREVVEKTIPYCPVFVTDDASKDKTPEILEELKKKYPNRVFSIRHAKNTHIPKGIQDGMRFALEKNYDQVITMDAGMSHDPEELPQFLKVPKDVDLVIGSRARREGVPLYRKWVSKLASLVMNYCVSQSRWDFLGPRIQDCTSGYRRYSRRIFEILANKDLESVAFDFHLEALAVAMENQATFVEIPITYRFSNSSFNSKVLWQAIQFARKLIYRKWTRKKEN